MKRRIVFVLLILVMIVFSGCGPDHIAGPFVTDVTFDKDGNLIVTKQMLLLDFWSGKYLGETKRDVIIKPKD